LTLLMSLLFFFQAEDGIRDFHVTGVQTCALPISGALPAPQEQAGADRPATDPGREGVQAWRADLGHRPALPGQRSAGPLRRQERAAHVTATIAPVTIRSLRQSTINDAMTCLHRLTWVDDPDYPYQASASTAMGTGYHAGLEAAYRRRMEGEMWATVLPDIDFFVTEAIGALAMEIE